MTFVKFGLHLVNQTLQIMKSYLLFPNKFRMIGWMLFIPGFILGAARQIWHYQIPGFTLKLHETSRLLKPEYENFTNELALALVILGIMFVAFAKLKREDELTSKLRLNALYWAILTNYIVVIWSVVFSILNDKLNIGYEIDFLDFNLYAPLLAFIARFYYLLHKNKNEYYIAPLHLLRHTPYNKIARLVALPSIILFVVCLIKDFFGLFQRSAFNEYTSSIYAILPIVLLIWMYSKERVEDEYVNSLRLHAVQIAVYINCAILLIADFVYYGLDFFVFEIKELTLLPLVFVIVFQYNLYRLSHNTSKKSGQSLNVNIL